MRNRSVKAMMVNEFQAQKRNPDIEVEVEFLESFAGQEHYEVKVMDGEKAPEVYEICVEMRQKS